MEQQLYAVYDTLQQVEDITKNLPDSLSMQKTTIHLYATYRIPVDIHSDQGIYFIGHEVQEWADTKDVQGHFHLPYNPTATGL